MSPGKLLQGIQKIKYKWEEIRKKKKNEECELIKFVDQFNN